MNAFTLIFTSQELDYVAKVLQQQPYAQVAALLDGMQRQLAAQQQKQAGEPKPAGDLPKPQLVGQAVPAAQSAGV